MELSGSLVPQPDGAPGSLCASDPEPDPEPQPEPEPDPEPHLLLDPDPELRGSSSVVPQMLKYFSGSADYKKVSAVLRKLPNFPGGSRSGSRSGCGTFRPRFGLLFVWSLLVCGSEDS